MRREDIENYLSLLGEELEGYPLQEPIRLLMIGGGFMLTQVGNRETTKDIDVFVDIEGHLWSEEYGFLKNAAWLVAYENKIDQEWFSTTITDFLRIAGPVPRGELWRAFGRWLHVYIPSKEYILAHKLQAAREKDDDDIRALCSELGISTPAQARKVIYRHITNTTVIDKKKMNKMFKRIFST